MGKYDYNGIKDLPSYEMDLKLMKTALTEVSELYGFPTAAIVSMPEVIEYLGDKLDPELKSRIDAYYEEYGAKE